MAVACRRALRDAMRLMDHSIDCGVRVFHIMMKILGPLLICLALSLIGFVTYTFFVHALPQMETIGFLEKCGITLPGLFLVTNMLYNYGNAICRDPGLPPEFEKPSIDPEIDDEFAEPPPRQCSRCLRLKPPRCHHCSVCRRCVLKMDHHCPWINNCVGFGNYRYFCLFLLYLAVSCAFVLLVFLQSFTQIIFHVHGRRRIGTRASRQCIMTSFMICCSIFLALCMLGGFHVFLVLTNQTTIEFQTNIMRRKEARRNGEYFRNPYDLGRTRNFQQVFGPNPFCRFRWLLPWMNQPVAGNGLQFPSLSRLKI